MLNIKLDIQKWGGKKGTSWTEGITESDIDDAYKEFSKKIKKITETILDYKPVDEALQAGWSGTDCNKYLEKFHAHAESVCTQIEEYNTQVAASVEQVKAQWEEFQDSLIN